VIFRTTEIEGVYVLELERREDARGFFAEAWSQDAFRARGLQAEFAQWNVAWNRAAGTLRGMHFQLPPHEEVKIVRCTFGACYDVALDLRRDSPTFRRWVATELSAANGRAVYVPRGCAHGYQTLAPGTEVAYLTSSRYAPSHARGVRFDDPAFGIRWPLPVACISDADRAWPPFR
jgi:dTDP-4-dehydrorhamnose 3,5-epimerase